MTADQPTLRGNYKYFSPTFSFLAWDHMPTIPLYPDYIKLYLMGIFFIIKNYLNP